MTQVFLVHLNLDDFENVILIAKGREDAKQRARRILGGDPDKYVVTPITELGSTTTFLLES